MRLRVGTGLPNIQKPTLMNLEIQKLLIMNKIHWTILKNIDILITLTQNKLNQLKSLKILPPKHVHLKITPRNPRGVILSTSPNDA